MVTVTATAEAEEPMQQTSLFLVPQDSAFAGHGFRKAPELQEIAETLITRHGYLQFLMNADIRYLWKRKSGISKGKPVIGNLVRGSNLVGYFSEADFIVWLSASTARDAGFTDRQVEAAIFYQLCRIDEDDKGNYIEVDCDFYGFAAEVREYGAWREDLKVGRNAFRVAAQLGLDDPNDDADGEADDDGEDADDFDLSDLPD